MTPPFIRPFGLAHGGTLSLNAEQANNFQATPEYAALERRLLGAGEAAAVPGNDIIANSLPACRLPDCNPLDRLPDAVTQSLAYAEANPVYYRAALNLVAAQVMNTTDAAQRAEFQARARQIARDALDRISDPNFQPEPEDSGRRELPVRTRARILFNIVSTLSVILARPQAEAYTEEDRALLRSYFVRIRSGVEQLREIRRLNAQTLSWPEYFSHYLAAQIALVDGQPQAAFSELLRTRQLVGEVPPASAGLPLPTQVRNGTELALRSMPRPGTGGQAENLRNLISVESLAFIYQAQYLNHHGEEAAPQASQRAQALSLVAATYLQAGNSSLNATALLEYLRSSGNASSLRQTLSDRLRSDESLRTSLASLFPGNLGDNAVRDRVAGEIVNLAQQSATAILSHADENPYRVIFTHDGDARPIAVATEVLSGNAELLQSLRQTFGYSADDSAETVVRDLVSFGETLPALLETLPPEIRTSDANRRFFRELNDAALGLRGDGLRLNLEQPLLEMLASVHRLAGQDDDHAAAYYAIFETMKNLEQIGPGLRMPASLGRIAGEHAQALVDFSGNRVIRHLTSPSSIGMIVAGSVLSEISAIWLLRGARIPFLRSGEAAAAVRSSGEMGILMNGGRLTGWGEAVSGLGVGLAMQVGAVGAHLVARRGYHVTEYGQELRNLGLMNLAMGTLTSMAALGVTMGAGNLMRRGFLPSGRTLSPARQGLGHLGLRLGNWGIGGASMLLAHSATAAASGHSATPTGEQAAEIFISMALWDLGAMTVRGVTSRTSLWRHQAGPYQVERAIQSRLETILARNRRLDPDRVESYLRTASRDRGRFERIGRSLESGMILRSVTTDNGRRLVFRDPPVPPTSTAPAEPTPTGAPGRAEGAAPLSPEDIGVVISLLQSSALTNSQHPDGIHALRLALRERLSTEENPVIWGQVSRIDPHLAFEILPAEPTGTERDGTFRMTQEGRIENLVTEDAILQAVIGAYNHRASPIQGGARRLAPPSPEGTAAPEPAPVAETAPPVEIEANSPTGVIEGRSPRQRTPSRERGDTTVEFSPEQARRARDDSRPIRTGEETTTIVANEVSAALAAEMRRDGSGVTNGADRAPTPPRQESEPPRELDAADVELVDETSFAGIGAEGPSAANLATTIRPQALPPPLPSARQALAVPPTSPVPAVPPRRDLAAAQQRRSGSAAAFTAIIGRVTTGGPADSSVDTMAIQASSVQNYQAFVRAIMQFVPRLYNAHLNSSPEETIVNLEINTAGEMRILNLRDPEAQDLVLAPALSRPISDPEAGVSYIDLHRFIADAESPNQVEFLLHGMQLSQQHETAGWRRYLLGAFPPPEPLGTGGGTE